MKVCDRCKQPAPGLLKEYVIALLDPTMAGLNSKTVRAGKVDACPDCLDALKHRVYNTVEEWKLNLPNVQETDENVRTYEDDLAVALEKCVEVISELGFDKHSRCVECKATVSGKHALDCDVGKAYELASEVLNRPDNEAPIKEM